MNKNTLTVLGSGICYSSFYKPNDYRNPSGHLLTADGVSVLFDVGDGIRRKFEELRFDYYKLARIFISHFHPDHFSIDAFIQAFFVRAKKEKKLKKLEIYGPPKIEEHFREIWNRKNAKTYEESFPGVCDIAFHEYLNKATINIEGMKITPHRVVHGGMDAYSFRCELGATIFVYSGDAAFCKELIVAAKDADTFLCEAGLNIGEEDSESSIHLSPFNAGQIAKSAVVKTLILVHYSGKDSKSDMIQEVKRSGYRGEIHIADDLDSYPV